MIAPKERAAQLPTPVGCDKVLLAEGDTPTHFFEALLKHLGLHEQIEIRNYGGITQLRGFLKTLASTAEFKRRVRSLGVVRDAENDAGGALASVSSAVADASLPPAVMVRYYILPNNKDKGMIETLLQDSVADQAIFQCVRDFFTCLGRHGFALPLGPIEAKHYVQVYLATKSEVQMMPGIASYKGAWPFDHDACRGISDFLRSL